MRTHFLMADQKKRKNPLHKGSVSKKAKGKHQTCGKFSQGSSRIFELLEYKSDNHKYSDAIDSTVKKADNEDDPVPIPESGNTFEPAFNK